MPQDLFAHLAMQFSSSPENLATEGLSFVLNRSATARQAFIQLLARLDIALPDSLKFETQTHSDQDAAIPDLIGVDADGQEVLLGEAKFWAGLTDNQPVTYLQRLIQSNGRLLLFLAPAIRFPTLWPELQRRCTQADLLLVPQPNEITEVKIANLQGKEQILILMSWRVLLDALYHALLTQGEMDMAGNVAQLQGLCQKMDNDAFLPLQSEELDNSIGRRQMQYCDLVDEVTQTLVAEKFASTKGLKSTGQRSGYLRYMKIQDQAVSLGVNNELWGRYRATPIWLGILSDSWEHDPQAQKALISLETAEPPRLFRQDKTLYIPLFLEPGREKDDLVKSILAQIREVFGLLKTNRAS